MHHQIEKRLCDYCESPDVHDEARKPFPTLFTEDGMFVPRPTLHPDYKAYTKLYGRLFKEAQLKAEKNCVYFEADCHGDAVAICYKHFAEIAKELDDYENQRATRESG
jgi:hypothetical protein